MAGNEDAATMGDNNPPIEFQQGPLVSVTFQKNPARKEKYLEAQPKALGITQIGLSVYQLSWVYSVHNIGQMSTFVNAIFNFTSAVVMIAGGLAIAAKNLHITTLRACLVLQIIALLASLVNLILMLQQFDGRWVHGCWFEYENGTNRQVHCQSLEHTYGHCYAGGNMVQMSLVAISATLMAYCCKVINCCSPASRMPVIAVQAPPPPQPTAVE